MHIYDKIGVDFSKINDKMISLVIATVVADYDKKVSEDKSVQEFFERVVNTYNEDLNNIIEEEMLYNELLDIEESDFQVYNFAKIVANYRLIKALMKIK